MTISFIVNRQCEFFEFKEITKIGVLEEQKNPYFVWKNRLAPLMEERMATSNLTFEEFVETAVIKCFDI